MVEVAKVTVEAENPPPVPVSVSSTETPQAEASIAAAIQTGAAAEKATAAAEEAKQATNQARNLVEELTLSLKPELEKISERLAALEAMEEEEREELELEEPENDVTLNSRESVNVVSLPEPRAEKPKESMPKPEGKRGGGFLYRLFLNK